MTGGTAIVFGVHESVNDMTGLVSGGWPRDWWADDRSPFPGMTEIHILNELGFTSIATADDQNLSGDPLYVMFKNIQNHYGWGIFSRMFAKMRANNVNWSTVDSGHNPSSVLTNLVTAYMVIGSGDTLSNMNAYFTSAVIPGYNINTTQTNLTNLGYAGAYALFQPTTLTGGQKLVFGTHSFVMQTDGNLVEYNGTNAIWASGTNGHSGAKCTMQADGNLVVYSSTGGALWATGTSGHPGAYSMLQADGNFVVYTPTNNALWATGTQGR